MERGSLGGRIMLVILLAWGLLMILPDCYAVVSPLGAAGLAVDNDGVVFDVRSPFRIEADSPAWQAGLRVGDRLDLQAMNCRRLDAPFCNDLVTMLGGMGGTQRVAVEQRLNVLLLADGSGVARALTVTAAKVNESWIARGLYLANEITGVLFLLAAAWLVYLRPGRMSWGFFLYANWFNPGHNFVFYLFLQHHPALLLAQEVAGAIGQGAGYAGLLQFALRVPSNRIEPQWRRLERRLPIVAAVLAVWQIADFGNLFGFHTEALSRAIFVCGLLVDAGALFILFGRLNGQTPQNRQRLRWIIAGCLLGVPADIVASMIESTSFLHRGLGVTDVPPYMDETCYLVQGVLAWFVFEAVRRPRVVSVTIPLSRITLFGLLLSVPVLLLHQSIEPSIEYFHEHMHLPGWGWLLVGSLTLYLISRLHEFGAGLIDHIFNRAFRREALRVHETIEAVLQADTIDEIEKLLVDAPQRHLSLASAALFRLENGQFTRTRNGPTWSDAHASVLNLADPALATLRDRAPIPVAPEVAERLTWPEGLPAPTLAVPVADRIRCFAIVLYGPHASGADLNTDERDILGQLAKAAAVAYAHGEAAALRRELEALRATPAEIEHVAAGASAGA